MAGLDSIKGYDDGGGVSVTESSKGTPQIQGATYLDPEQTGTILQNMQKLIEARSSPMQQFLGGLKGAAAWTSGGINGPSEALNRREEQEQAEQKDTMNMQNQMAMYKAALAQQQAQRQSFLGALNPQQQQGAGAGQAQPQSAGAANIDPTLMAEIQRLAANPATSAQAQAMYQKALTENAGFIAKAKAEHDSEIVEFPVNGQNMKMARGQANQLAQNNPDIAKLLGQGAPAQGAPAQGAPTGAGQVAADVNNPTGIRINGKFKPYDTPQEGVADSQNLVNQYVAGTGPMQGIKPTPENIAGRWVTGDPNQGSTLQNGAYAKRIRDELQSAGVQLNPDGTVPNTPEAQFAVHRAKIINEAGPNANKFLPFVGGGAPAAAPSGIGNVTQAELKKKQAEADIDVNTEERKKIAGKAGERESAMMEMYSKAPDAINDAILINNLAKTKPHIFGLGINNPAIGAIGTLAHLSEPEKREEFIANRVLNKDPEDRAAWGLTQSAGTRLGISYVGNAMRGARIGVGLEKMGVGAKGVGAERTAAENLYNSDAMKEAFSFARQVGDYYQNTWKPQNPGKSYEDFEGSKAFQAMDAAALNRLHAKYPQYFSLSDKPPGSIENEAVRSFGAHEPDKYEYRINPETGKVQRKAKQ